MDKLEPLEKDDYAIEEADSDNGAGSSDDEAKRDDDASAAVQQASDEFEMDMEDNLEAKFGQFERSLVAVRAPRSSTAKSVRFADSVAASSAPDDDVDPTLGLSEKCTDSDEEFQQTEGLAPQSYDFYDPSADQDDERWVEAHRRLTRPDLLPTSRLRKTDAVLNCPSCMSLLCLDCQRHAVYRTQYRAMFVENCTVKSEDTLYFKESGRKNRNKRLRGPRGSAASDEPGASAEWSSSSDVFHPVECSVCKTEVAVIDADEVYHFFNVLVSCP